MPDKRLILLAQTSVSYLAPYPLGKLRKDLEGNFTKVYEGILPRFLPRKQKQCFYSSLLKDIYKFLFICLLTDLLTSFFNRQGKKSLTLWLRCPQCHSQTSSPISVIKDVIFTSAPMEVTSSQSSTAGSSNTLLRSLNLPFPIEIPSLALFKNLVLILILCCHLFFLNLIPLK